MKEWIFKIAVVIIFINGLGELAISQIHILAITKLFANEIGLYLFLFVIFGLTTAFNVFSLERPRNIFLFVISSWAAAGFGYIYLTIMRADVASQNTLTMADVNSSWLLMTISVGIYLVGSLVIPFLSWENMKLA